MRKIVTWSCITALVALAGCATRPVNPPIAKADPSVGYTFQTRQQHFKNPEILVVLAFSGGGTRAAAFSYGVLELLRNTEAVARDGRKVRLIDAVDVITGVSGGSFTALAYGLYGEKLFDDYEQRFLKRNVQGEIIARAFSPSNWGNLSSLAWGRSELAADLYDEILFNGATFADLDRGNGPLIMASATDISTGGRIVFTQNIFNVLCSDLNAVRLSRAAAASSAVPVVLSSVTINNYGGTCDFKPPAWTNQFLDDANPPRPAARVIRELRDMQSYSDSKARPYIHLVDGGVSDNVGMRGVLDALQLLEALHGEGQPTPLDNVRKIVVFVVNSLSSPPTSWDQSEAPPGVFEILVKATGVPIDHYSYEAVELLKDISARWNEGRRVRALAGCDKNPDGPICKAVRVPQAEIYPIDVSFAQLRDEKERAFLNEQPTSFVLTDQAVDRLRAAAGKIVLESPEFQRLMKDLGARIVPAQP
ncbi:MAG: patatin-like phospholipase family protein [Burkholderiales bacterium]